MKLAQHPKRAAEMQARLKQVSTERPPLSDLPMLIDPALPYVHARDENKDAPAEIKAHVDAIRATQPKSHPSGQHPWPCAPKGGKIIYTGDGR